jgi:arsenite methyltransferase
MSNHNQLTESDRKKKWVRERYGAIARGSQTTCCGAPACDCEAAAASAKIGYSRSELGSVPEGANMGLGCGNPFAIAGIRPGEVVLDLGSGGGFDAFLAAARVGPAGRVIGVDMTPAMIRKARANARRAGHANVEFRRGDIEALPVDDASVDLVISNCVLNLVPDKPRAFREIARVLKPGGRMAVADIVLDKPLPEALKGDPDAYCSCVSGAIGRREYLRGLRQAGLTNVRVVSEADAAGILAGDCCAAGVPDIAGVVTSVHVAARKPASRRRPSAQRVPRST